MGTVEKGSMRQEKGGGEEWRRSARRGGGSIVDVWSLGKRDGKKINK